LIWLISSAGLHAAPADPEKGSVVFARRCSGCHNLDFNNEGPRLHDVFGRRAGSVAGFPYSQALRNSGMIWNEKNLDLWLANPEELVKGNDMEFRVADAGERARLIGYFKSLATAPAGSKSGR
jgi:cytochrome c